MFGMVGMVGINHLEVQWLSRSEKTVLVISYGFMPGASLVGAYMPCSLRVSSSRLVWLVAAKAMTRGCGPFDSKITDLKLAVKLFETRDSGCNTYICRFLPQYTAPDINGFIRI